MDGRDFDGARIVVQPGRGHRPNGPKYATRRTEHRITVENLDSHTSWQDLKVRASFLFWFRVFAAGYEELYKGLVFFWKAPLL